MKETINNIHVISKGILISVILHMIVIGFLVITGFNMSLPFFTAALFVVMAASGFYVGTISDRYAEINGLIVSIITSTIVLLYVAQYTSMNWSVNQIFIASYLVIGFISSLISRLTNKRHKVKKKETENKTNKVSQSSKRLSEDAEKESNNKTNKKMSMFFRKKREKTENS